MDVKVHGIPAHAWDRSTAEYLLCDSCIITNIHPCTSLKNDLSSFRLRAWCSNTVLFPRSMKLLIVEPGTDVQEKRCLSFDIEVAVTAVVVPTKFDPLQLSPLRLMDGIGTRMATGGIRTTPILHVRAAGGISAQFSSVWARGDSQRLVAVVLRSSAVPSRQRSRLKESRWCQRACWTDLLYR